MRHSRRSALRAVATLPAVVAALRPATLFAQGNEGPDLASIQGRLSTIRARFAAAMQDLGTVATRHMGMGPEGSIAGELSRDAVIGANYVDAVQVMVAMLQRVHCAADLARAAEPINNYFAGLTP
jgi:hypothetical protein